MYNIILFVNHIQRLFSVINAKKCLQINVLEKKNAQYVESQIPIKDMLAFVCEDKEDVERFLNELRGKQGLRISAVLMPPNPSTQYKPLTPINHFKYVYYQF